MEIQEKRVLRRKIPLLKRVMTENSQLLTACVSQGLIAKEQLKQLTVGGVALYLKDKTIKVQALMRQLGV